MTAESVTERLTQLGFSTYEARTCVGLLGTGTATGYAVATVTGVPQPKVYETLRRLKGRGAVVQVGGQPARWSPVPPDTLLEKLDQEFTGRLDAARAGLAELAAASATEGGPHLVWHDTQRDAIVANVLRPSAGVVEGYIRHDVFVQRMDEELPDEMERHFGPGLLRLADLSAPAGTAVDAETPDAAPRSA